MKTQEILSIVALSLLGLCLLCGLAKMAMKKDSAKKNCDKACSMAVFTALTLLTVSQLIGEKEKYITDTDMCCCANGKCEGGCEDCPDVFLCQHKCIDHNLEHHCGLNVKPGIPICKFEEKFHSEMM